MRSASRSILRALAAACAMSLAGGLAAQQADSGARPRATPVRCVWPLPAHDSARVTVYAHLAPFQPDGTIPELPLPAAQRAQLMLALQEIRGVLEVPQPLRLVINPATPFVSPSDSDTTEAGVPSPQNRIAFTLHADGSVTDAVVAEPSAALGLDSALLRALRRSADGGALAGMLIGFGARKDAAPDSVRMSLATFLVADTTLAVMPLFRSELPGYRMVPVIPDRQNRPPPYPPEALALGVPGEVVLQFVVDTLGRADLSTVRVLSARYREFVAAAARQLRSGASGRRRSTAARFGSSSSRRSASPSGDRGEPSSWRLSRSARST